MERVNMLTGQAYSSELSRQAVFRVFREPHSKAARTLSRHDMNRQSLPLPSTPQICLSRIGGIYVTPHTESMRFVRHRKNRTMLSQNVTCCSFGATCDRFVSPIMYVKLMYTLLREVESGLYVLLDTYVLFL